MRTQVKWLLPCCKKNNSISAEMKFHISHLVFCIVYYRILNGSHSRMVIVGLHRTTTTVSNTGSDIW